MIEGILQVIAAGLAWLLASGWRALPLLVLVLVADALLRRRIAARFHCVLWMLVLVRMLCPLSFVSPVSVQRSWDRLAWSTLNQIGSVWESDEPSSIRQPYPLDTYTYVEEGQVITAPVIPEDATDEYRAEAEAYVASLERQNEADQSAMEESPEESPEAAGDYELLFAMVVLGGWFIGVGGLLMRSCLAHWRFARKLKRCRWVSEPNLMEQVSNACKRLRVRHIPEVREVNDLEVPAVFGLRKHTICLPPGTAQQLSRHELDWVLMHEIAHLKRRDPLILWIATVIRCLQWFNPFAHLAVRKLSQFTEQAADDLATRRLPDRSAVDYGRLLLRYASPSSASPPQGAIGLLFVSSPGNLRHRIEMLNQNSSRNHWFARFVAAMSIVLVATTGFTDTDGIEAQLDLGHHVEPEFSPDGRGSALNDSATEQALVRWQFEPTKVGHLLDPISLEGPLTTQTYDVQQVLEKLAEEGESPHEETALLSVVNLIDPPLQTEVGETQPVHAQPHAAVSSSDDNQRKATLQDGMLTVRRSPEAHLRLRRFLDSIKRLGLNTQVTVEVRVIQSDVEIASAIDWIGRAKAITQTRSHNFAFPSTAFSQWRGQADGDDFAVLHASDGHMQSRPVLAVKVSKQQRDLMIHRAQQERAAASILNAPKVTLFAGQEAQVSDSTFAPFVTGIQKSRQKQGDLEPVIEVVPLGWRFQLYAEVNEQKQVQLQCQLSETELKSVELANLPFASKSNQAKPFTNTVVQVPNVARASIRAKALLDDGESLLIMSPETYAAGEPSESFRATFYLLSAYLIEQEPLEEGSRE